LNGSAVLSMGAGVGWPVAGSSQAMEGLEAGPVTRRVSLDEPKSQLPSVGLRAATSGWSAGQRAMTLPGLRAAGRACSGGWVRGRVTANATGAVVREGNAF